jgi:hypothetical protein
MPRSPVDACRLARVLRRVDSDELIDGQGVAGLLYLSQRNSMSAYERYPGMPRPVSDLDKVAVSCGCGAKLRSGGQCE